MALVFKCLHSPNTAQRFLEPAREEGANALDGLAECRERSPQVTRDDLGDAQEEHYQHYEPQIRQGHHG
jgi:hypothetical protein